MKKSILLFLTIVINVIASAQRSSTVYESSLTSALVYFDSNKTDLKPESVKVLDSIVLFLQDKTWQMDIKGYCDNTGIDRFNQILSDLRAEAVFNYFRTKNISSSGKFTFKGFSTSDPIEENLTEKGKAKNRRVEIVVSLIDATKNSETKNKASSEDSKKIVEQLIVNKAATENKAFSAASTINDLEVGKTLVLQNLNFEGGTAILLPEAQPTMELLLKTMKDNPTLKIEIGGHVCCFDDMPLSILRAQTVLKHLAKKGIDESRMTYKGYSRNKPIIEDDRQEANAKINRRVEITVLKK